ncbi:MAG: flotillin, partial [Microbacterium sp.]|nr:flotillin [Microbacterium sp.]
ATGLDLAGIIQGQAVGRGFGAGVAEAAPAAAPRVPAPTTPPPPAPPAPAAE